MARRSSRSVLRLRDLAEEIKFSMLDLTNGLDASDVIDGVPGVVNRNAARKLVEELGAVRRSRYGARPRNFDRIWSAVHQRPELGGAFQKCLALG